MKVKGNLDVRGNIGVKTGKTLKVDSGATLDVDGTTNLGITTVGGMLTADAGVTIDSGGLDINGGSSDLSTPTQISSTLIVTDLLSADGGLVTDPDSTARFRGKVLFRNTTMHLGVDEFYGSTRFTSRPNFINGMKVKGDTSFYGPLHVSGQASTNEKILQRTNKVDVDWDWRDSNSYYLKLNRSVTVHTPTNIPASNSMQVNLVVQQSELGFYNIKWSKAFKWVDGVPVTPTQSAGAVDAYTFHISPALGSDQILAASVQNLFYL